ncbi:MAG: hypothetical protein ACR2NB_04095 [Solirubrobacteraceae bacterium]
MTGAQKVVLGQGIEPDIADEARTPQVHGRTAPGTNASGRMSPSVTARDDIARKVGLGSGSTCGRANQVIEAVPAQQPRPPRWCARRSCVQPCSPRSAKRARGPQPAASRQRGRARRPIPFATQQNRRGTKLSVVQQALGHESLATTSICVDLARDVMYKELQQNAL